MQSHSAQTRHLPTLAIVILLGLLLLLPGRVWGDTGSAALLAQVYARLAGLDGYTFSATVQQTTHPLPTLANVGLSSETASLLVLGSIDKPADLTQLTVSEQSGHLLDGLGQMELKLQAGQVWGRVAGQGWEKLDASAAPDQSTSDPAAFLQAARNVHLLGTEERLGLVYTVYSFELDGAAWAELMRQQLQAEMLRRGELAPGEVLDRLEYYERMTGVGEIWLNSAGLPQRLSFHAIYPPLPGETEYKEVETITDYSDWRGLDQPTEGIPWAGSLPTDLGQALPQTASDAASAASIGLLLLLFLLFPVAIVRYRHSPRLYRVMISVLMAIFVSQPLLSASVVQAAGQRRDTRVSAALATQAEDNRIQAAVEQVKAEFASSFDVSQGLAAQVNSAQNAVETQNSVSLQQNPTDSDGDGLPDAQERLLNTSAAAVDSDGDGVDDASEVTLGLNPANPDSDGDLISDGFEVAGIELGGKRWYLDPLNSDSNGDSILDSMECIQAIDVVVSPGGKGVKGDPKGTGICADTDGDAIPDFADDDNDNDGVADWIDGQPGSRFGDMTSGVKDSTFAYGISDYSAGKPLRLTFEVRPTNPQHLWYSMNVLDWPTGDYEGQIRRVHDTKLGSTGAAANGDMQLVPMLEVILPGDEAIHLPTLPGKTPVVGDNSRLAEWLDMATLQRYQMAVSWTADKRSIQVFLPATLIRDSRGNAPVNFVAKMLYLPNGTGLFSKNHTARLVWLVQMDVDNCVVPTDSSYADSCTPEGKNYANGIHWQTTKQQLVHRYYDSFFLTAFTAEEDLSNSAQIFYENPAQIPNPAAYVPDQLLGLGTVLESYLRQKKSPSEALAAFQSKNPKIGSRLVGSPLIQDADAYGLLSKVTTQEAPRLLDTVFAPHRQQLPYPAMLYVIWGESKVTGLAGIATSDALRLRMTDGSQKSSTSIRLGAFVYNANPASIGGKPNPNWDAADAGKIWANYLQGQSAAAYQQLPQAAQQKFNAEQFQQATLGVFWNLARGVTLANDLGKSVSDGLNEVNGLVDEIGAAFDNGGENSIGALISVFDDFKEAKEGLQKTAGQKSLLSLVGKDVKNPANLKGALKTAKFAKGFGLASVTFAGASATLSVVLALKDQLGLGEGTVAALEAVNATIGAVLAGLQLAQEITKVVQAVQAFSGAAMDGLRSALAYQNTLSAVGVWAAVVVAALILVAAFVMYFKLLSDGDAVAARTALAQGVATAIIVLLLFVISLFFPIGTAIALLVGLLDGIFTAICKIANWAGGKDESGQNFEERNAGFCKGIVGNVVAAIAGLFYKSLPMVDMAYADRLQFGQTDTKLIPVADRVGMNAGNRLQVTQPVTITVRLPDAHSLNQVSTSGTPASKPGFIGVDNSGPMTFADYDRLIKEKNVFTYELISDREAEKNSQLADLKTPASWKSIGQPDNRNRLYKTDAPTIQITLTAGINWNPDLFVREYYSYALAECGLFAGGCDYKFDHFNKFKADTQVITIGTNLIYDVFPTTLTDFYTLEQVQENGQFVNRYRLAWGGKKPFPTLRDADGDGLAADIDPDDKTTDADADGLPDAFEVQDFRLNPLKADSDSDGLSDYQEMRRGTRPDRADTDGDGLSDFDEISGWELVYVDAAGTTKRTWVTADPLVFDTDGDGFSDQQERVLGAHPRARNSDLSVLTLRTRTNQTGSTYLAPSQTIAFTSTVSNDLRKPVAYGLLEAEILNSAQGIAPITFALQPQQSRDLTGSIAAPAAPVGGSEEITLRNRAGANLVDPSASYADQLQGLAQPNGLKFQLNFEQRPADERSFRDVTGNATLTCAGDYCPSVVRGTDSYGAFQASSWYSATGSNLAFTQPRFSLGGWVTLEKAFGGKYSERVLFGPDNAAGGVDKYLQLSVVDLPSDAPKARISFTATDDAVCEQVLTGLTVPIGQKTHVFVTYDGTLVHAYKNGQPVGSYTLQNCAGKVPAGNRFTVGRGSSDATLYVHNVYYRTLDEGDGYFSGAEAYLQLNSTSDPFARWEGVKNGQTRDIGRELSLRTSAAGDANSTVYLCEEDRGEKTGQCRSDATVDPDDFLGTVNIDPRRNGSFNTGWSSGSWSGTLHYNIQNNFFQGSLDDLRIYESTLTPQEVGQLINGSGLTFQLDEASGRTQFRNAGVDVTQLFCTGGAACPTSGLKGYSGQAVGFSGGENQSLMIERLRERFGSNLVTSFWFKPEAGSGGTLPLLRYGQSTEGFTLFATQQAGETSLRGRFNYSKTDPIGGSGGNAYDLRCNAGEALVGIHGGAGSVIDRVGPICVATTASYGSWLGDPVRRGTAGGSGGGGYERLCPVGSFVTGFAGRAGGLVDRIEIECARPLAVGVLDSRNPTRLEGAGGAGGDSQSQRVCPSNLPAVGIFGRAGGLVDAFGLTCQAQVSAASNATLPVNRWSHVALAQNGDTLLLYVNGQPAQNIWFGLSPRAEYRLTGGYWPDLSLGNGVKGLVDELQVQGLTAPIEESIRKPFTDAALVHLALDETAGSATFANSTGRGDLLCGAGVTCPQSGLKGQVRESLQFNSQPGAAFTTAPRLTVPTQPDTPFSFSTWVKLVAPPSASASLIALHADEGADAPAWRLQLLNSGGQVVPQLVGSFASGGVCSGNFTVTPANVNLALNQWHHLGVNYDPSNGKNDVSLYLNGRLIHRERVSGLLCRTGTTLRFGQGYRGQMDEFFYYAKSLEVSEFLSQYVYQSTWFDTISTEHFRVDYNGPTVKLTTAAFVKPGTNIFGVAVSDAESGIRSVEYKDADGAWKPARSETSTSGVWVFGRDVQGSTSIEVRATDNVGNVSTDSKTVNIDNTPPVVALTTSGKQNSLTIQGTVSDAGSGLQSATLMIIDPFGQPFSSPRDVAVVNGAWRYSQELPPTVNGAFQVWMSAVDQMGNQFRGIVGSVQVDNAGPTASLGNTPAALTGVGVNLPILRGTVSDQPNPVFGDKVVTSTVPSLIQKVEVGFLHRQDKDDPSKVIWREATLGSTGQTTTTWQLTLAAELEGIYDISLRAADALGNQRVVPGIWTGVIDTRSPRIALAGTTPGQQSCTVTDFSLGQTSFTCGNVSGTGSAASALYASGVFTAAGLVWNAGWYRELFRGRAPADRLYALRQSGANFTSSNLAESCDIYGNCARCTVTNNNTSAPVCTVYSASGLARAASAEPAEDENLFDTALTGPGVFSTTVYYERPDAYIPGAQPAAPTSEWMEIGEPYTLIDNATLAATRPFAADFNEAHTEIEWTVSLSATGYYVGWTLTETVVISDLTAYATPGVHSQSLADRGRYYAHVVAVDAAGETNAFSLGPVYFDGAPPASYLNWDEFGPGQPYWLWQEALSPTGQPCNLLGQEDRASLFSGGASARSRLQSLYGTWNDEWLALHWDGLNLESDGDLHLYLDSQPGGALYAYDPYTPIAQAQSLVVMPERRHYQANTTDRMLADFAVFVEDGQSARLLRWDGSSWQEAATEQMRFSYRDGEAILWLALTALGVNPNAVDVSLVGFLSEEESMQIWATMPGNNPLNSPALLPSHLPAPLDVNRVLLNLQTSMRLSSNPAVNNSLDNCPTNLLFDQSLLDVQFSADPAAEVYDPVVYEGVRAVVADDVEALLATLCAGVVDVSQSPVCELAQQIADNAGGGGPAVGPSGQLPASAGPGDELIFYATLRNLSSQATGKLALEVKGDLPSSGSVLEVGYLAPFETRVVSFTEVVDPNAAYDFTAMTIYPVEEVENSDENLVLTYEHPPHTVIHDIDRNAPISGELSSLLLNGVLGTGEQLLEGLVYDQSPLAQVTLQTSLGETVTCGETAQIDAFTSEWACAIHIPENTPDGAQVEVSLSATDIYGFASGVIAQGSFAVDNTPPELTLFDAAGRAAAGRTPAGIQATANATETLLLEGLAGDERWLGGVQVCDGLQGYESCQEAEMFFFSDLISDTTRSAALSTQLADEAYWSLERTLAQGIAGATVPFTVTAYDAAGNGVQQSLLLLVDTLAPTVTLAAQPVVQIAFDGAFSLNGSVSDRSDVAWMELEVVNPLGEYGYYPIALDNPGAVNSGWHYERSADTDEFAIPGDYTYFILAYDELGNEREVGRDDTEVGPYSLTVGAPDQPLLNAPFFVESSDDLWAGFAPGATVYLRVQFDDDDLSLGDSITVTADPFPTWLVMTRLDEYTVEISGTVPLTITQTAPPASAPVGETETITPLLQINAGLTITDSTGRQAYRSWTYEQEIQSSQLYLPLLFKQATAKDDKKLYLPTLGR